MTLHTTDEIFTMFANQEFMRDLMSDGPAIAAENYNYDEKLCAYLFEFLNEQNAKKD